MTELYKDKDWLIEKRRIENMTKRDMADLADCGRTTINRWLDNYGIIPRRDDPECIRKHYIEEGMSSREIADKFNCGKSSILRTMDEYNIERRDSNRDKDAFYGPGNRGYLKFRHKHHHVYEHRLLAVAEFGFDAIKGKHVHHKNHFKFDNRPSNIELMTPEEHMQHHHAN